MFTVATSRRNILASQQIEIYENLWTIIIESEKLENFSIANWNELFIYSPARKWSLNLSTLLRFRGKFPLAKHFLAARQTCNIFHSNKFSTLRRLVQKLQGGNNKITHNSARQSSQEIRCFFFLFCSILIVSYQDIKCIEFFRQDPYLNSQLSIQLDSIWGRCFIIIFLCSAVVAANFNTLWLENGNSIAAVSAEAQERR